MNAVMDNTVTLNSDINEISKVEGLVSEIFDRYHINQELYGNVLIALTEAANNAIMHGNGYDAEKKVIINFDFSEPVLKIRVSDEGNGFDFDNLPDPTEPEYLDKPCGRGVFLIKRLADNVDFDKAGSTVSFSFKCQ
jgi:serine/threonine-protein kinase RsbW